MSSAIAENTPGTGPGLPISTPDVLLAEQGGGLVVSVDGSERGWFVPRYFAGRETLEAINDTLDNINSGIRWIGHPGNASRLFGLGSWADNVLVLGEGNMNLIGMNGRDVLIGGSGGNYLSGGHGQDWLLGNGGDDELWGDQGDDTLRGGAGDDKLEGEWGDDHLMGGAGNDRLCGGQGDDILDGGIGDDLVFFGKGDGHDRLMGAILAEDDRVRFEHGIDADRIWLQRQKQDLQLRLLDSGDTLTMVDWYGAADRQLACFELSDARTGTGCTFLARSRVEALVQAMAAFTPPRTGSQALAPHIADALAPVLAASWQAA